MKNNTRVWRNSDTSEVHEDLTFANANRSQTFYTCDLLAVVVVKFEPPLYRVRSRRIKITPN